MDFDNLRTAWRENSASMRVSVNADSLRTLAQADQRTFFTLLVRQDLQAIGIAMLMPPLWIAMGVACRLPWTWYLSVPAFVWVGGFILCDQVRQIRQPSFRGESLLQAVKRLLSQVDHQIWLLRRIFWWYLLPFAISLPICLAHLVWIPSQSFWGIRISLLVVMGMYAIIYCLNKLTVKNQLEPRRNQLLPLFISLREESEDKFVTDVHRSINVRWPKEFLRPLLLASLCCVVIVWMGLAGGLFDSRADRISASPELGPLTGLVTDLL